MRAIRNKLQPCHTCGQTGHKARDCPQTRCFKCHQSGHKARNCPNESKEEESPMAAPLVTSRGGCHRCGQPGHWARECPQPQLCHRCHEPGHKARDCPGSRN
ncbi:MAG: hypothetical protein K0U52_13670 [Gammaproteobacteria bacterium]|nr:hypothetical protein [Gammaproteobacteria bacterium]